MPSGRRRVIVLGIVALVLQAACSAGPKERDGALPSSSTAPVSGASAAVAKPNIVFVLTDDLSSNLVPFMPHVQELQSRGITFSNYIVSDSLCCPSRASIFSGRFPHDTQVFTNLAPDGGYDLFHARGEESDTFATTLKTAGYRTAMMGKYLNGYEPASKVVPRGWDEWDVAGFGYPEFDYDLGENGQVKHYGNQPQDYLTDVLAKKGVSFIDRAVDAHVPFLLDIATFAPHTPYTPAPRDAAAFPGLGAPRTAAFNVVDPVRGPSWLARQKPLGGPELLAIDTTFRRQAQSVQAVDAMIGQLEAELAAKGVADNTYIVFSSDNGYHLGEHRLPVGKMTAFDTDIRVPLVVAGPGVPRGRIVNQIVQNIDLRPTFEGLGGAATPPSVDGYSLVPLVHGESRRDWRDAALVEHHGPVTGPADPDLPDPNSGNPPSYAAIRTPNAVYVEYVDGEREYYDIAKDPDEIVNRARQLSGAQQAKLHATLMAITNCHDGASCWTAAHLPA